MFRSFGLWARYTVGLIPCFEGEGGAGGGSGTGDDAAVKKAHFERDTALATAQKLQGEIDKLKGAVLTDDDRKLFDSLKKQQADAEEIAKKKAGEWDALKQQLVDKHAKEVTDERSKRETAEKKLRDTLISREFAGAKTLFGGTAEAKTVLTHDVAEAYFSRYVDIDESGAVVVKNAAGQVILDPKTGKPAGFEAALAEVIEGLPNKNNLLRGSGKAGSGSSGGGNKPTGSVDFNHLTPEQMRDPAIIKQAQERTAAAGGMVMGSAFDSLGAKK